MPQCKKYKTNTLITVVELSGTFIKVAWIGTDRKVVKSLKTKILLEVKCSLLMHQEVILIQTKMKVI